MSSKNQKEKEFNSFIEESRKRQVLNDTAYDKTILTLSATAFGLSVNFTNSIVPFNEALYIWVLISGWIFLIITVFISLIAFKIANKAIVYQIEIEENNLHKEKDRKNIFDETNNKLNIYTGILFTLGITLILIFLITNIL